MKPNDILSGSGKNLGYNRNSTTKLWGGGKL